MAVYLICSEVKTALARLNYVVDIMSPTDFVPLKGHPLLIYFIYPFCVLGCLLRATSKYQAVVFHSYSGWVVTALRRFFPTFRRLLIVTEFHGLEPLYYQELEEEARSTGERLRLRFKVVHDVILNSVIRYACRKSDMVWCLNSKEKKFLISNEYQTPDRIAIVANGVGQMFFISRSHEPRARNLLFVGQWLPLKGIRYLVEVFSELAQKDPELILWVVGTVKPSDQVHQDFPTELRTRVKVYPSVSREQILNFYRASDIFLFPSLFEGYGLALVEAMATGMPVVATPAGIATDILFPGVNALVVEKRDVNGFVAAVRKLASDSSLREYLGRNAQETARQYELERAVKQKVIILERKEALQNTF